MAKQSWVITLDITQECDEDMSREEMEVWINSRFKDCDYGAVRCVDVQCTELTKITINVTSCISPLGLQLAIEALVDENKIDEESGCLVYHFVLEDYRRNILEKLVESFGCTVEYS